MPKIKYMVFLTIFILINPCFSEVKNEPPIDTLSIEEKTKIYDNLKALMKREDEKFLKTEEEKEEEIERERGKKTKLEQALYPKWQKVMKPRNNSYLKTLFKNDKKLFSWMKRSPEPLFAAIQFKNMDMIKFFVEEGGLHPFRKEIRFTPLHSSIIIQDIEAIEFFLNHPDTDLNATNIWGDNIFHILFFGSNSNKRNKILRLFLQENYFSKISHLLNEANDFNQTVFDFALREGASEKVPKDIIKDTIKMLSDKGALPFRDLYKDEETILIKAEATEKTMEWFELEREISRKKTEISRWNKLQKEINRIQVEILKEYLKNKRRNKRQEKRKDNTSLCQGHFAKQ